MKSSLFAVWACAPRVRGPCFLIALAFLWASPSRAETITMADVVPADNDSAEISGYVYYDANADDKPETTDWALYGAEVSLTNVTTGISTYVFTNMDGSYAFTGLAAGTYTIAMLTPCCSPGATNLGELCDAGGNCIAYEGLDVNGHTVPAAGTALVSECANITLGAGYTAEWYDFGELVFPVALMSKQELIGGGYQQHLPPTVVPLPPNWSTPAVPEPAMLAMAISAGVLTLGRLTWRARRARR